MNGGGSHTFLIIWLGVWTIAGGFALRALRAMFRPTLPPSVRLESDSLQYDSGDRFHSRDDTGRKSGLDRSYPNLRRPRLGQTLAIRVKDSTPSAQARKHKKELTTLLSF
jgi:hypothetical protein